MIDRMRSRVRFSASVVANPSLCRASASSLASPTGSPQRGVAVRIGGVADDESQMGRVARRLCRQRPRARRRKERDDQQVLFEPSASLDSCTHARQGHGTHGIPVTQKGPGTRHHLVALAQPLAPRHYPLRAARHSPYASPPCWRVRLRPPCHPGRSAVPTREP